jgi:hypothetical protein
MDLFQDGIGRLTVAAEGGAVFHVPIDSKPYCTSNSQPSACPSAIDQHSDR